MGEADEAATARTRTPLDADTAGCIAGFALATSAEPLLRDYLAQWWDPVAYLPGYPSRGTIVRAFTRAARRGRALRDLSQCMRTWATWVAFQEPRRSQQGREGEGDGDPGTEEGNEDTGEDGAPRGRGEERDQQDAPQASGAEEARWTSLLTGPRGMASGGVVAP